MTGLDELLGEEYGSADAHLYLDLAREDQNLLARLIEIRKARMSQEEVAQLLGITQASVSAFERLGNDPKLSSIRRYAKAIGAMVRHQVDPDPGGCTQSHYLTHVGTSVLSTETASARVRRLSQFAPEWPTKVRAGLDETTTRRAEATLADPNLAHA